MLFSTHIGYHSLYALVISNLIANIVSGKEITPLAKIFRVKILDLKYHDDYEHLNFTYFIYDIETDTVEKARSNYMEGKTPLFSEELPFLLKLFSVDQRC